MDKLYRTALYGRISKDDKKKVTIENQQRRLREWATCDPFVDQSSVLEFWDEGVSGKIPLSERPAGRKLMEAAKSDLDSVAVVFADRFGRTLLDGLEAVKILEGYNVKIVSIDEGWDARRNDSPMWFQMRLLFAEEDHRRIRDRTRVGTQRAIERDKAPPGGPLTFGYRLDTQGRFVVDPVEAAIVQEIFERFLRGDTQTSILNWLKTTEVRAGRRYQLRALHSPVTLAAGQESASWHLSRIKRILTNRTYIGERRWASNLFDCVPLVSIADFEQASLLLSSAQDGRSQLRGRPEGGLLSGLLTCGLCGKMIHACNKHDWRMDRRYSYRKYVCDGSRDKSRCKCKAFHQVKLDEAVWATVERYLWNPQQVLENVAESDRSLNSHMDDLRRAEAEYQAELDRLNVEVQKLWQMKDEQNLTLECIAPGLKANQVRRDAAAAKIDAVRRSLAKQCNDLSKLEELQTTVATIRTRLAEGLTAEEKRHILKLLLSSAVVRTNGTGRGKTADVLLSVRWGGFDVTDIPNDHSYGSFVASTISLRIAV